MTTQPLTADEVAAAVTNGRIGTDLFSEEAGMRVWHLHIPPGATLPAHRHYRPYFWTVLTNGRGRSRDGNGRVVEVAYRAGETRHFPDHRRDRSFVHDLTNTGETELIFVTVELDPTYESNPALAQRCPSRDIS